ncbi:MAG: MerR family transcriptional regulator [Dehalococcoidia bacterium]
MKISELSSRTGVSIPTLKFYLREGLLPQGQLRSPNQADYDESHVRRADLIRALRDIAGLSIAKIKAIVDALEHGEDVYDVMGTAVDSLGGETIEEFTPAQQAAAVDIDRFLESLDLPARPESLARHQLIAAFASVREMLFPEMAAEFLMPYAQAAIQISALERAGTPGLFQLEPELAVEKAVLGIALFEPILVGFRRLAHERQVRALLQPGETPDLGPSGAFDAKVQIPAMKE